MIISEGKHATDEKSSIVVETFLNTVYGAFRNRM
jgi:hypothetical protein